MLHGRAEISACHRFDEMVFLDVYAGLAEVRGETANPSKILETKDKSLITSSRNPDSVKTPIS